MVDFWGEILTGLGHSFVLQMASVGMAPMSGLSESSAAGVDKLPEEMNDMKIRDDKVCIYLFDGFFPFIIIIPAFAFFLID